MAGDIKKNGFTLVETLITVAIIVILASIVAALVGRFDSQAKEKKLEAAFGLINSALEEFKEYNYKYNGIFADYSFPLDCTYFSQTDLQNIAYDLGTALGLQTGDTVTIFGGTFDPNYSGCAVMYFFLNKVQSCRTILEGIDRSLIVNLDASNSSMSIKITKGTAPPDIYPFYRIVDPWGTTLRYDYYDETIQATDPLRAKTRRSFPLITSAGPDKMFGTADDITNK